MSNPDNRKKRKLKKLRKHLDWVMPSPDGVMKIQRSITTSDEVERMLFKSDDDSIVEEAPLSDNIRKLMGGRLKVYCYYRINKAGRLELLGEPEDQEPDW